MPGGAAIIAGAFGGVRPKDEVMEDRANVIKIICEALSSGDTAGASAKLARRHYPFLAPPAATANPLKRKRFGVFVRDGFVDRYSGNRLYFHRFSACCRLCCRTPSHFIPTGK